MSESAAQLFSRLGVKPKLGTLGLPFLSHLHDGYGLQPGDVIELCGSEGSGKSELLLNVTAQCVLPYKSSGVLIGGCEAEVVFISTDRKLDLLRLVAILEGRLSQVVELTKGEEEKEGPSGVQYGGGVELKCLLRSCLSRVHTLLCDTSEELLVTLHSLRQFLHTHPSVSLIAIDPVGAFFWSERSEFLGTSVPDSKWVNLLSELAHDYHLVIFGSRTALFQQTKENGADVKHNLCPSPAWQRLAKNSFLVSRHSSSSETRSTALHEFRVKPTSSPTESRTASSVFCVHNKGVWFARS